MDKNTIAATLDTPDQQPIRMDGLCFPACCRSCGHYGPDDSDSGWCHCHGGWVSPNKWACSDYV